MIFLALLKVMFQDERVVFLRYGDKELADQFNISDKYADMSGVEIPIETAKEYRDFFNSAIEDYEKKLGDS